MRRTALGSGLPASGPRHTWVSPSASVTRWLFTLCSSRRGRGGTPGSRPGRAGRYPRNRRRPRHHPCPGVGRPRCRHRCDLTHALLSLNPGLGVVQGGVTQRGVVLPDVGLGQQAVQALDVVFIRAGQREALRGEGREGRHRDSVQYRPSPPRNLDAVGGLRAALRWPRRLIGGFMSRSSQRLRS